jgi:hypothetical protein
MNSFKVLKWGLLGGGIGGRWWMVLIKCKDQKKTVEVTGGVELGYRVQGTE